MQREICSFGRGQITWLYSHTFWLPVSVGDCMDVGLLQLWPGIYKVKIRGFVRHTHCLGSDRRRQCDTGSQPTQVSKEQCWCQATLSGYPMF